MEENLKPGDLNKFGYNKKIKCYEPNHNPVASLVECRLRDAFNRRKLQPYHAKHI